MRPVCLSIAAVNKEHHYAVRYSPFSCTKLFTETLRIERTLNRETFEGHNVTDGTWISSRNSTLWNIQSALEIFVEGQYVTEFLCDIPKCRSFIHVNTTKMQIIFQVELIPLGLNEAAVLIVK